MERVARLQLRRSMAWRWQPVRDTPQKVSTAFHSASGRFAVGGANLAGRSGVRKNSILPIISERFRRWFDGLTPHSGPLSRKCPRRPMPHRGDLRLGERIWRVGLACAKILYCRSLPSVSADGSTGSPLIPVLSLEIVHSVPCRIGAICGWESEFGGLVWRAQKFYIADHYRAFPPMVRRAHPSFRSSPKRRRGWFSAGWNAKSIFPDYS